MYGTGNRTSNLTTRPIVQSDTAKLEPPAKAIILLEGGALKYTDTEGNTVTKTFPTLAEGGIYPFQFNCMIAQVFATGTDITDDQMIGLH